MKGFSIRGMLTTHLLTHTFQHTLFDCNTSSNTHFSTHSFWLVKIHMGPTKSCGSYILLVGPMWIL